MSQTQIYHVWVGMLQRCENPKNLSYNCYGGRGIKVCERWHKFESFYSDVGNIPEGKTLDRWPDNDGNYEPSNCRWTTQTVQARNTRRLCKNNTSGYRGVRKKNRKWSATIIVNSKRIDLGYFTYAYTAGYVYDSYVLANNLEHTRNFN